MHVNLRCIDNKYEDGALLPITPYCCTSAALESLRMGSTGQFDFRLLQKLFLFDLSHLRILTIGAQTKVPWLEFIPIVQSIEILRIFA
ncbi:hypothetical protein B0H13DRAFT_2680174, partial [Mycena leptocephala]